MEKEYDGTVYFGVVGSEIEIGECRDTIERITLREGDTFPIFHRFTKGYEGRQGHINNFLASNHDFLFLIDADQTFPPDCLEKLRNHKLPYVSGVYLRRQTNPIGSIWYEPYSGKLPYMPWVKRIEPKLYEIGASGWGCVLIHRDVVTAVRNQLKGEWEIFEDYMDVYPYDIVTVFTAMKNMRNDIEKFWYYGNDERVEIIHSADENLKILEGELRLLRGDKDYYIGSDIRFPFFALQAGYKMFGDGSVVCGHMVQYPIQLNDYNNLDDKYFDNLAENTVIEYNNIIGLTDAIKERIKGNE